MPSRKPRFNAAVTQKFADEYYGTVRGWLRRDLIRRNLEPYLPKQPAKILDFGGGGSNAEALWLAHKGHHVDVIDESRDMCVRLVADLRLPENRAVRRLVRVVNPRRGTGLSTLRRYPKSSYDIVLSHGVLPYELENRPQHVEALFAVAKPLGRLSIAVNGLKGKLHEIEQGSKMQTLSLSKTELHYINNLGLHAVALSVEATDALIVEAGGKTIDYFGIRSGNVQLYDGEHIEDVPKKILHDLIDSEYVFGQGSRKDEGQMLQFIAEKPITLQ